MRRPRPSDRESGFVLIGVIMFVLALTILGLSLFNLSGYEVQFLEESRQELQAFYAANGGIERAKLMLQTHNTLDAVKKLLPVEGVVYARARFIDRPADTTNADEVDWSGTRDLEIRVLAVERGKRRMVEARYRPVRNSSIYENLIVSTPNTGSSGRIFVRDPSSSLILLGSVRQEQADTSWVEDLMAPWPTPIWRGDVPLPAIQQYILAHQDDATVLTHSNSESAHDYYLSVPGKDVHFHVGDPQQDRSDFGFGDAQLVTMHVKGTAILLFPAGGTFERTVTVVPESPSVESRLIIVAGRSSYDGGTNDELSGNPFHLEDPGLTFEGGIISPQVPVILISDGPIGIAQHHWSNTANPSDYDTSVYVNYLSVFGAGVVLGGPDTGPPGNGATATYQHDSTRDATVLDPLIMAGLLPNTTPGQYRLFVPVPMTWREVTESDPD